MGEVVALACVLEKECYLQSQSNKFLKLTKHSDGGFTFQLTAKPRSSAL